MVREARLPPLDGPLFRPFQPRPLLRGRLPHLWQHIIPHTVRGESDPAAKAFLVVIRVRGRVPDMDLYLVLPGMGIKLFQDGFLRADGPPANPFLVGGFQRVPRRLHRRVERLLPGRRPRPAGHFPKPYGDDSDQGIQPRRDRQSGPRRLAGAPPGEADAPAKAHERRRRHGLHGPFLGGVPSEPAPAPVAIPLHLPPRVVAPAGRVERGGSQFPCLPRLRRERRGPGPLLGLFLLIALRGKQCPAGAREGGVPGLDRADKPGNPDALRQESGLLAGVILSNRRRGARVDLRPFPPGKPDRLGHRQLFGGGRAADRHPGKRQGESPLRLPIAAGAKAPPLTPGNGFLLSSLKQKIIPLSQERTSRHRERLPKSSERLRDTARSFRNLWKGFATPRGASEIFGKASRHREELPNSSERLRDTARSFQTLWKGFATPRGASELFGKASRRREELPKHFGWAARTVPEAGKGESPRKTKA